MAVEIAPTRTDQLLQLFEDVKAYIRSRDTADDALLSICNILSFKHMTFVRQQRAGTEKHEMFLEYACLILLIIACAQSIALALPMPPEMKWSWSVTVTEDVAHFAERSSLDVKRWMIDWYNQIKKP